MSNFLKVPCIEPKRFGVFDSLGRLLSSTRTFDSFINHGRHVSMCFSQSSNKKNSLK